MVPPGILHRGMCSWNVALPRQGWKQLRLEVCAVLATSKNPCAMDEVDGHTQLRRIGEKSCRRIVTNMWRTTASSNRGLGVIEIGMCITGM
jgi:hypothetical protein